MQQIVGLLTRSPGSPCADPQRFVERVALRGVPPEKHGERNRPPPDIASRERAALGVPSSTASEGRVYDFPSRDTAVLGVSLKQLRHSLQKISVIPAVVIGERDDLPRQVFQSEIKSSGMALSRS